MPATSRGPAGRSSPSGPRSAGRGRTRAAAGPQASAPAEASIAPDVAAAAAPRQAERTPGPSLTTRAAVLLGVVALLAASYSFPLRSWLNQRGELAEAQAQRDALARDVDQLTAQQKLWDDPAYVRAQARERLNFVLPGEAGLVVLGTQATDAELAPPDGAVVPAVSAGEPWWNALVAAFTDAGESTPP